MRSHNIKHEILNFESDCDSDGIPDALEYVLGTNPRIKSKDCIKPAIKNGKFQIEHTVNDSIEEVEVEYLWSKDLVNYHQSGQAAQDGTVVVLSETESPSNLKEVVIDIVEGEANSVYVKMEVTPSAVVNWGSDQAVGGALFSNASQISLVDTNLNLLADPISVGYDPYGIWGYARIDQQISNVQFLGVPLILIDTQSGSQGLVSSSNWTNLLSASAPSPVPINSYNIGINDTEETIIDWGADYGLSSINLTQTGGVGSQGYAIYVVPEITIDPEPQPEPGPEPEPNPPFPEPEPPFWTAPPNEICPDCIFSPFGGTIAIRDVYVFQTDYW
jgi:hypothetical protein